MNDRDMWWKISMVGAMCAIAFAAVWPMNEKLKYGIDLYGGYSLLYEIDDTGLSVGDRAGLSEKVMKVLRERVDPKGVFNLVWRPVGQTRLEIQMPRPSDEVRKARQDFEKHQTAIRATLVSRSDLLKAISRAPAERPPLFDKLSHGIDRRKPLLEAAAKAYDEFKTTEAEYNKRADQIKANNITEAEVKVAVEKKAKDRNAVIPGLIKGIPARQGLLQAAGKAWDDYQAAAATTQPAKGKTPTPDALKNYTAKGKAYEDAIKKVLDTNVDPNKLAEGATLNKTVELEDKFNAALGDVLATNIDINTLQIAMDLKPSDPMRTDQLAKLRAATPSLAPAIDELMTANDKLKTQRRGEGRLEDPADLQRLLRGAGVLEFRILAEQDTSNPEKYNRQIEMLKTKGRRTTKGETTTEWFEIADPQDFLYIKRGERISKGELESEFEKIKRGQRVITERYGDKYYVLAETGPTQALTHRSGEADWTLKSARYQRDDMGKPAIGFQLDERGGEKFAVVTRINKGHQLAIFLDDQAISHATIQSVIRTSGQITGSFTQREVMEMVKKLEAGSLPKKLKDPPISVRSIGPSLGEANRAAGLKSAYYGSLVVCLFMLGYYFYAGGIAVIATVINMLFTLAVMAVMGATLTLPGIAGLVLAVGMAVDANVLINERMREEMAKGTAMRMAIKLGYERAFRAILDSHVTTIITSIILYFLGSEEIKGFGLTLGIGVLINLFTAYFVTRMFFETMSMPLVPKEVVRNPITASLIVAAFGGLLYAGGYAWNTELMRQQSVLIAFGRGLMYVAPFVIGLMLIMFLWRAIHASFQQGGRPRMPMLHLIGAPNIDWIKLRPVFFLFSGIVTVGGLFMFLHLDPQDLYDIEFLGGTAAQIDLKVPGSVRQPEVLKRLEASGKTLENFGTALANATVTGSAGTFVIHHPGVPAGRLEPMLRTLMDTSERRYLNDIGGIQFVDPGAENTTVRTATAAKIDVDKMKEIVTKELALRFKRSGEWIARAQVQSVSGAEQGSGQEGRSFEIVTLETNKDTVVGSIMQTMQGDLDIQPALTFSLLDDANAGGVPYFAIRSEDSRQLNLPVSANEMAGVDLSGWKGAVAMVLDKMNPPQTLDTLRSRLRTMRLQPGFEGHGWRESEVVGLIPAAPGSDKFSRVMVLVNDENYPLTDEQGGQSSAWVSELAEPEVKLVQAALQRQTSLSSVTQFDKQVSGEAKRDAYIAIALSWIAICIYLWFRFGNFRWGAAAVVALVHDVITAVGCIAACHYIAGTAIGKALMIEDFRVDLSLVAALLTVIGYSVNDTIIVFDRIRENRGRLPDVNASIVNHSISQTLGRTLLTTATVFFTIIIMYIFGGPGIHGFAFAMFIGVLTGTYSSFGIASQLLIKKHLAATK